MNTSYKSGNSIQQIVIALAATIVLGSVALVGTVGPATAAPVQIAAQPHG